MGYTEIIDEPPTVIRSSPVSLVITLGMRLAMGFMSLVFDCWVAFTPYEDLFGPEGIIEGGAKR